ncbi:MULTISPECIES: nucleotidyltransferase family protein [Methylotenera]|uniref:nucleotidyltransferase family protein n=1 Tax=Methylotenera TaxID=359407 RepID=UPI000382B0EF|nr:MULTISPECIES: nucleotidyltransferase family protein [Methylotenera]
MVGILLAAGFSRRFGSADKLLQLLPDGRPIALASAEHLIQAIPNSIAVLRAENKTLATLLLNAGLKVIFCNENEHEMADSLTAGIRFSASLFSTGLEVANDGFVIALADMPYIQPETIRAVANKVADGASIVIPTYQNQRGHPVGFLEKFRNELENLQGNEGARSIIKRYADEVYLLPTDDAGILADIDTPADLAVSDLKN